MDWIRACVNTVYTSQGGNQISFVQQNIIFEVLCLAPAEGARMFLQLVLIVNHHGILDVSESLSELPAS